MQISVLISIRKMELKIRQLCFKEQRQCGFTKNERADALCVCPFVIHFKKKALYGECYDYTYDGYGNIKSAEVCGTKIVYGYDNAMRLKSAVITNGGKTRSYGYTYSVNNKLQKVTLDNKEYKVFVNNLQPCCKITSAL